MKKLFCITCAVLFSLSSCFSQDGYKLTIKMSDVPTGIITLSLYKGSPAFAYVIDSVKITRPDQTIIFSNTKKILGGLYRVQLNRDKQNAKDIVLDNGAIVSCTLSNGSMESLATTNAINKQFFSLSAPGLSAEKRTGILQSLIKSYPASVVSLYAKLELKKTIASESSGDAEKMEVRKTYLQSIDLNDKRMQLLPNIYSYLFQYTKLTAITNENYQQAADAILKGMKCTDRNYIFYLDWIFKNIKFYEAVNLNDSYKYVYNKYLGTNACSKADQKFYDRITAELNTLSDLRTGMQLPAFEMQDSSGVKYRSEDLLKKSNFTLIAFYDPECEHCKVAMPRAAVFFNNKNYNGDLIQLIAFRNTTEEKGWNSFVKDSKLKEWKNVKPAEDDPGYITRLKIYSNPTFILVDSTGKIRLLKFNETDIVNILEH